MNEIWQSDAIIAHTQMLARSFRKWTGRDLLPGLFNPAGLARNVFEAPFVLVSHGTETDPVLNYGNRAALKLWEMSWDEFTRTPSRLTAEVPERAERARFLETVARDGFIENYSGVRISQSGKRFRIRNAIVWNLLSTDNQLCGQAAMFERWEFL
ncbi:MAG TPA: MEKHLA domain-containing protein [Verrucomicrobiae bacterium]|nr:MEKHLA domain-containing protein [Verrucomicrobiae bacterium]